MLKQSGNIISLWAKGSWAIVLTNGVTNRKSATILTELGSHIVSKNSWVPETLREFMRAGGIDKPYLFPQIRMLTLPVQTKHDTAPNISVLAASAKRLLGIVNQQRIQGPILLPWRGRSLEEIALLERIFDDRFVMVMEMPKEVKAG